MLTGASGELGEGENAVMEYLTWMFLAALAYGMLHVLRRMRRRRIERLVHESRTRFTPLASDPSEGFVCSVRGDGTGGHSIIRKVGK